jgi:hypothetical protein
MWARGVDMLAVAAQLPTAVLSRDARGAVGRALTRPALELQESAVATSTRTAQVADATDLRLTESPLFASMNEAESRR